MNKIIGFWQWFLHASWIKKIVVIIVTFILLVILKRIFLPSNQSQYTFDTVSKGTISQLVTESGNVISSHETDVFSPTTGSISQVYVKNGDHVNAGDKLFAVQSTATEQEQAAAYANYLADSSTLQADNATLYSLQSSMYSTWNTYYTLATNSTYQNGDGTPNTTNRTLPAFTVPQDNWLAAEAQYKNQQAVIAKDQAALNSTSLAYQATQNATVTAPIAGTVSNLIGLTGAKVTAQLSSAVTSTTSTTATAGQAVTPVLIVGNSDGYAIHTAVSEVDINKIAIGQNVQVTFGAIPNKIYSGNITQTDTYGTDTAGVITYNVFITLNNGDQAVKPNMSANLTIDTAEKKNVLTAANTAIVPYQNGNAVQIVGKNGKVQFIPVAIGLRGFTRSEIVRGVNAGTKVILGNTSLQNNQNSNPNGQ